MKHVKKKMVGDVAVVYPKGTFTGGKETDELHAALLTALEDANGKLIVNFHHVKFFNSAALGVLYVAHKQSVDVGGRICVCRIPQCFTHIPWAIFIETYETEEHAVASFRDWKPPEVPEEVAATR